MKLSRTAPLAAGPLGLTALLNVVLLLLFFFVLGSSLVLQPGTGRDAAARFVSHFRPRSTPGWSLSSPGRRCGFFTWTNASRWRNSGGELAAYRGSPRSIILRADRGTPYESVVAVMDLALKQDYTVALATVPALGKP